MKRVIITGSKGGTGRSLVKHFKAVGYDVVGVDVHPPEAGDGEGYVRLDLTEAAGVNDVFAGADALIHFGSPPSDKNMSTTEAFHQITVAGFNVLQAAKNTGIQRIAWASSIKVYGDLEQQLTSLPLTENEPTNPCDIYGVSKLIVEQLSQQYCLSHGMSVAAMRLGRIVYENAYAWRLKPHTETDQSGASALWCYIDARDVAVACQRWLESDLQGFRAYNIAAEDVCLETPTKKLIDSFYAHVSDRREDLSGHTCPFCSTQIIDELSWQPQYNWRQIRDEAQAK